MKLPENHKNFSLEEFREYQLKQLINFVGTISKHSSYYSKSLKNMTPITTYDQFRQLPFLEQEVLREGDVDDFRAIPWKDVLTVSRSSGTTGKSKLVLWSKQAIETQKEWCSFGFSLAGLKQNSRFAYFVPLEMNPRLLVCMEICKNIGAFCIPIGKLKTTIDTDSAINFVKTLQATTFLGTPSRLISVTERVEELGLNPQKDFAVTSLITGGAAITQKQRAMLQEKWGAELYNFVGTNELSYVSFECSAHDGTHLLPGMNYVEVIDPETEEPIVDDGKTGEIIITQFINLATPLLRYRIGDLGYLKYSQCSCGLTYPRLYITGRVTGTIAIGGTKIYAYQIESILSKFPEIALNYQAIIENEDKNVIVTLLIESELSDTNSQEYKAKIIHELTHDPAIMYEVYDKLTQGELQFKVTFINIGSLEKNDMDKIKNQYLDKRISLS